jgi:hypothetical protein
MNKSFIRPSAGKLANRLDTASCRRQADSVGYYFYNRSLAYTSSILDPLPTVTSS